MSQAYTATELLTQYYRLDNIASKTALGLPNLLPIRVDRRLDVSAAGLVREIAPVSSTRRRRCEPCQFITAKIPY